MVRVGPHSTWDGWSTGRRVSFTNKNRHQLIDGVLHGSCHTALQSGDPCLMGTPLMGPTMPCFAMFLNWQKFHSLAMLFKKFLKELSCLSMHSYYLTLFLFIHTAVRYIYTTLTHLWNNETIKYIHFVMIYFIQFVHFFYAFYNYLHLFNTTHLVSNLNTEPQEILNAHKIEYLNFYMHILFVFFYITLFTFYLSILTLKCTVHAIWPYNQIMSLFLDICYVRNVYCYAYVTKCQRTDDFYEEIFVCFHREIFYSILLGILMRMSFTNEFMQFVLDIAVVLVFNVCKYMDLFIIYVSIYYEVVYKIWKYG